MTTPGKAPVESVRVASDSSRPAWLPWLIGLVLLALLGLVLLFLFDDDEAEDTADVAVPSVTQDAEVTDEPVDEPTEPVEPTDAPAPDGAGAVVVDVGDVPAGAAQAGEIDVFADQVSGAEIVGETITANQVLVQELVADEAFYVGPEVGNTILVRLAEFGGEGEPESPFTVEAGDMVNFTGQAQEIDDAFLAELQLYDGADQLELGDYYVQVDQITSVS